VHTPHRDKKRGTERTIALIRELRFPEERVLIDHNNEETLPLVLATGCLAGHSIYPNTKMDARRMVALVQRHGSARISINSAADWGVSDPLAVAKTVEALVEARIDPDVIDAIVWRNPLEFFAQSGRLDPLALDPTPKADPSALHEGNSVLRGQAEA
jgi:predicted metal-dependent TIM-barrel fold hydrolase